MVAQTLGLAVVLLRESVEGDCTIEGTACASEGIIIKHSLYVSCYYDSTGQTLFFNTYQTTSHPFVNFVNGNHFISSKKRPPLHLWTVFVCDTCMYSVH